MASFLPLELNLFLSTENILRHYQDMIVNSKYLQNKKTFVKQVKYQFLTRSEGIIASKLKGLCQMILRVHCKFDWKDSVFSQNTSKERENETH